MDPVHTEETLIKFFSTQGSLRIVKLDVERGEILLKKLVLFVLQNCRNLRELTMGCGSKVELSSNEAYQLLDSITTLRTLRFDCFLKLPVTFMSSPRDLALSRLYFYNSCDASIFFYTLLAGCQKVEHLYCSNPSDGIIALIFENLVCFNRYHTSSNMNVFLLWICVSFCFRIIYVHWP